MDVDQAAKALSQVKVSPVMASDRVEAKAAALPEDSPTEADVLAGTNLVEKASGEKKKRFYNERTLRSQRSQQQRLEADKKACEHCGVDDYQFKLRVCSGCNLALYCSDACQRAARGSHQRICDIISELPSTDSGTLVLTFDRAKTVDFAAGLRYGTKYMDNLKHLVINLDAMDAEERVNLSAKHLSSLFRSKRGALESVLLLSSGHSRLDVPGISKNGVEVWKELHGLKQLRLDFLSFDDVQPLRDIIIQQQNTLMVLCLPGLGMDWSRAKTRRTIAQAVGSCKHLVKLDLSLCVLMDPDLKIMLQDLPNLRNFHLRRHPIDHSHQFSDSTCGLIARKCPGLQSLYLENHSQLSVRGIRKIFEGCPHLRSFHTSAHKLSCKDVVGLLDIAPQLLFLSFCSYGNGFSAGEPHEIIEATGGRTILRFGFGDRLQFYKPEGEVVVSSTAREMYESQAEVLRSIWSRMADPQVVNAWDL